MNIVVLSGDSCTKCNILKCLLEAKGISYEVTNMFTPEGMGIVAEHDIRSIPQVIVDGKLIDRSDYEEVIGVTLD